MTPLLESFSIRGYRYFWATHFIRSLAIASTHLILIWLAFEGTGSSGSVAIVTAAWVFPHILTGLPAGLLADRRNRILLLVSCDVVSALILIGLGWIWTSQSQSVGLLVVTALLSGVVYGVRLTATQAAIADIVSRRLIPNGIALVQLAEKLAAIAAGLIVGASLETHGATMTILCVALMHLLAATLMGRRARQREPSRSDGSTSLVASNIRASIIGLFRSRAILIIGTIVIAVEVLGVSSLTLVPELTREMFNAGAKVVGWILSARALGALVGVAVVALGYQHWRKPFTLTSLGILLGAGLLLFPRTSYLLQALLISLVIGSVIAAIDAVAQAQIQLAAESGERGVALGLWVMATGFGPLGHLMIGVLASLTGAATAQTITSSTLIVICACVAYQVSSTSKRDPSGLGGDAHT